MTHNDETSALLDSGECGDNGDNVKWSVYENGMLYIYGSGNMGDYAISKTPFYAHRYFVTSAVVEPCVTRIGDHGLSSLFKATSITIPDSVTSVGIEACRSNVELEKVIVGDDNSCLFSDNGVLIDKNKARLIVYPAAKSDTNYVVPDGVTSIEAYAFSKAKNLNTVTIPSGITRIGNSSFFWLRQLNECHTWKRCNGHRRQCV